MTNEELRCDACGSSAAQDDVFCGECGNRLRGGGRGDDSRPARRAPSGEPLPQPPDDLTTRHLCATAHLDEEFADFVAGQLIDSKHRAIHPCPGVDLVAVTRHAAAARMSTRGQRFLFGLIRLAALIAFIAVLANSCSSPQASVYGYGYTESSGPSAIAFLLIPLLTTAVILFILLAFRLSAFSRVVDVMNPAKNPRRLADAVGGSVENRVEALGSSNVIVFSGLFCGVNPFAGGGRKIDSWGIVIDIAAAPQEEDDSQPRDDGEQRRGDGGEQRRVEPFDAADLHDWLRSEVPDKTLPGLEERERLYVSGISAPLVPNLVPRPRLSPSPKLPDSVLTNVLRNPTGYARTYLCFEKSAWSGEFVFSYLVRAEILQNKTLFVEGVVLGMPPLTGRFLRGSTIPAESSAWILPCLKDIVPDMTSALFGRMLVRIVRSMRGRGPARPRRLGSEKDTLVDYGAIDSIRAVAAEKEISWYFFTMDELMYMSVLERRILEGTVAFLRDRGVDTSEFERQKTQIVSKNHFENISISNVSGSGIAFGNAEPVKQVINEKSDGGQR